MTDENKAISVNRWRLVLGGMSDKSLSFTGDKAEIITFQDMEKLLDYLYSRAQAKYLQHFSRKCFLLHFISVRSTA